MDELFEFIGIGGPHGFGDLMQLMLNRIGFLKHCPKLGPDGSAGFNFKFLGKVGNFEAGGAHHFPSGGFDFSGDNPQLGGFPSPAGPLPVQFDRQV